MTHFTLLRTIACCLYVLDWTAPALAARASPASAPLDRPTRESWPVTRSWDEQAEGEYGDFVAAIGRAAAAGRCRTLAACLHDPALNPLYEAGVESLRFHADCADVPYILRAYFAYRRGLPFAYAREMQGRGRDARYYRDARPAGLCLWREAPTPRRLLLGLGGVVHSGYFRTAPEIEEADFYPTAIDRRAIRPGTMYYDPNGHVVVVYEIRADGTVAFFDGHPDGLLTHGVLSEKNVLGGARQGGGFKNFRPLIVQGEKVVRVPNAALSGYGGAAAFDRRARLIDGHPASYHDWVRARLAERAAP